MTPHKVSQDLMVPLNAEQLTAELAVNCPSLEYKVAGAFWNIYPTHYYMTERGRICAFVVQQYNVFGYYHLGNEFVQPASETPKSCRDGSVSLDYYFYHGSIGYYSYYEEGSGSYCVKSRQGYATVGKLGSYDINGKYLAMNRGSSGYRHSYYYCVITLTWFIFRGLVVRRSYILCTRYARQCDALKQEIRLSHAVVFAHESCRLTSHDANNYQRGLMLYFLIESVMTDLFFLIAKDGLFARVQYVSLGYNLSGLLSVAFEIVETRGCLSAKPLRITKRLLFNYETALLGELACSAMMHQYLTSLNRSDLENTIPVAEAVSFYVLGLIGHVVIVLGLVAAIFATRILLAMFAVWMKYKTLKIFTEPCYVDSLLGVRLKMMLLTGYAWRHSRLYYTPDTLKSLGLLTMQRSKQLELLVHYQLLWFATPRNKWSVVGALRGMHIEETAEESCSGIVSMSNRMLGGCISAPSMASDEIADTSTIPPAIDGVVSSTFGAATVEVDDSNEIERLM